MGKGERTDFGKLNKSLCTNFYNMPSDFDMRKKLGTSFGLSREYYNKVYLEGGNNFDKNNPGPGKYNISQNLGKDAPKFSLYSKLDNHKFLKERNKYTPGPGDYRPIAIKSDGRYPVSNIKNTSSVRFSKGKRFDERSKNLYLLLFFYNFFPLILYFNLENNDSTDAIYNIAHDLNGTGKIFLSNYKSNNAKSIHQKIKEKQERFKSN